MFLSAGTDACQAAERLFDLLSLSGFPDVELLPSGLGVSFFRTPIDRIEQFSFDGANLHLERAIPEEVPEPSTLLLLSFGGAATSAFLRRRRRDRRGTARCSARTEPGLRPTRLLPRT